MKKIDITKLSIEYYHKTKKYYRVIYDTISQKCMFYNHPNIKEITMQTAMNWVRKGARLYEWREYDEWRGYDE